MKILEISNKYKDALDFFDIELLIAYSLGKPREFVLSHPEFILTKNQSSTICKLIQRRIKGEPIAYILGHKEFYGLDFIVNKHTLIPRPETELIVDQVLDLLRSMLRSKLRNTVIDIGTGSGCIIASLAHTIEHESDTINFYATDISTEALKVAKKNSKQLGINNRIKFIHGSLLSPFIQNTKYKIQDTNLIITANLPYLSKEIFESAADDVKKFEPKSALYSPEAGLQHYRKLLEQLKGMFNTSRMLHLTCFFEISPEQKQPITKLIRSIFPKAEVTFLKDLSGKWRVCKLTL